MSKPTEIAFKGFELSDELDAIRRELSWGRFGDGVVRLPRKKYEQHVWNCSRAAKIEIFLLTLRMKSGWDVGRELLAKTNAFENSRTILNNAIYARLVGKKGGRKSGYTLPDHLNQREITEFYVEQVGLKDIETEAARRVVQKFNFGRDENDDLPTGEDLNTLVRLLNRWREKYRI